jgi:transposase
MEKQYRPWLPRHPHLLPPSPEEWLPEGHLAYFILDLVEQLDLTPLKEAIRTKDRRGTRPYNPTMMVALLLYGYCQGVPSSRKIERATFEDMGTRVIAAGEHPDHTRISEFRRVNLKVLAALFMQVLRMCQKAGLVKLGHVSLDGTKVAANASKHKAMSYERMGRSEAELAAEVAALLRQAEETDESEDKLYGKNRRGDELPEELARREKRLEVIRRAKAELEAEAAAARARELEQRAAAARIAAATAEASASEKAQSRVERAETEASQAADKAHETAEAAGMPVADLMPRDPEDLPSHQVRTDCDGNPDPKAQRNFTDSDSRIMKAGSDYVQGYNCQAAVDEHSQIIVAQAVTNEPPDPEHLIPMMILLACECGMLPGVLTADNGYFSDANAAWCAEWGCDAYLATGRLPHGTAALPNGRRESPTKAAMREKLSTAHGRRTYSRRKTIVEPVFGQIKGARGLDHFLLRGLRKARGEWSIMCTTHNLLKLYRRGRNRLPDA